MALKRIGALWKKSDKHGKDYLSGTLDMGALGETKIMVFDNEKVEDNYPDFTVHLVTDNREDK